MTSLLEIFEQAKDMPNMRKDRLLIIMNHDPFYITNAKILDPYMRTVMVMVDGEWRAFTYKPTQAAKAQADFADSGLQTKEQTCH